MIGLARLPPKASPRATAGERGNGRPARFGRPAGKGQKL